jgi:amino acid adenylation domain-containing protein
MLRQAGARAIVATGRAGEADAGILAIDPAWAFSRAPLPEPVPVDPRQTAYIIFTSGSTGVPKGVAIPHMAALNTVVDINERFGIGPGDRVLALSALDFDLSVYDVFGPLSAGGSMVLVEEDARRDARRWLALAQRHEATVWNSVPTLLHMLLTVAEAEDTTTALRLALVSGDWIGLDLPGRLRARQPACRFFALGGATEASIWSNGFEVDRVDPAWASIPYGWPLRNQRFRVVDAAGRDAPDGVAGELWIGGAGLAHGYCNAPELTAERFVESGDGTRWYRTGDQGRYGPDGLLEFLGRKDHQVKLRGHRIELGEIEAALQLQPGVDRALAVVAPAGGARRLVAAVTACGGEQLDIALLRERVATRLPAYMVPEQITVMDVLPLSANGKLDRAAVANAVAASDHLQAAHEEPLDEWEARVAAVWQELLRIPAVGRRQSFFELGGDSLAATRFVEIVRQRHGRLLPLRHLFASPVLLDIATALRSLDADAQDTEEGTL